MENDVEPGESVTRGLAREARAGDRERFGALYERLAPALYAWARLRIRPGLRSRLEPEDLMHEVWVRALRAFPRYDPDRGSFRAWIFQVAKHVLLDALRRARPDELLGAAPDRGRRVDPALVPDEATAISRRVAGADAVRRFLERIESLNEVERDLLVHCGLEGMPIGRAAERLGLTSGAAERRWQRLRARMRERSPEGLLE